MTKASLLPRAGALCAAVLLVLSDAPARAAGAASTTNHGESTPVDLGAGGSHATHVGGGGSIVRTIVGLAIVIGVIYGVAWVLKQVKTGRQERSSGPGLASVASVPLGSGRSLHLVRAGTDLVLVGVAEHGVTPIRVYREDEAQAAGLIDLDGELLLPAQDARPAARAPRKLPRLQLPRPRLALPALGGTSSAGGSVAIATAAGTSSRAELAAPGSGASTAAPRPATLAHGLLDTLRARTVRQ